MSDVATALNQRRRQCLRGNIMSQLHSAMVDVPGIYVHMQALVP